MEKGKLKSNGATACQRKDIVTRQQTFGKVSREGVTITDRERLNKQEEKNRLTKEELKNNGGGFDRGSCRVSACFEPSREVDQYLVTKGGSMGG